MPDYQQLLQYINNLEINEWEQSLENSNLLINELAVNELPILIFDEIIHREVNIEEEEKVANKSFYREEQISQSINLQVQMYQRLNVDHLEDTQVEATIIEKFRTFDQQSQ